MSEETVAAAAYHVPVMLELSIDGLNISDDGGVFVDVTFGGGGHSREILKRMGPQARLFGFDQDADAVANIPADDRFTFVLSNFRYLENWMDYYGIEAIDGLIADLGVSSHHFDTAERGFSFRADAPLDMRMNRRAKLTAAEFLNSAEESMIGGVFATYGELRSARRLAKAIVKEREVRPFATTGQLVEVVEPMMRGDREKKDLAKVFQALRIEVNDEMGALREMIETAMSMLRKGGRLVVLTYHSLEDRMVKNYLRTGNLAGKVERDFYGRLIAPLRPVNNHVIVPTPEEVEANPRSRSAKLRIAEKL